MLSVTVNLRLASQDQQTETGRPPRRFSSPSAAVARQPASRPRKTLQPSTQVGGQSGHFFSSFVALSQVLARDVLRGRLSLGRG